MAHIHTLLFRGLSSKLDRSSLDGSDFDSSLIQHLKALRIRTGEEIAFLSGTGHKLVCKCVDSKSYQFDVLEKHDFKSKGPTIELILALPKKDSLAQTLTQCTELGLSKITLVRSEFSDPAHKGDEKILQRAMRVIDAAAEQSQSPFCPDLNREIPQLRPYLSTSTSTVVWANENLSALGRYGFEPSQKDALSTKGSVSLLVGPEGGWSPSECEWLESLKPTPLALGPQILKVPTAAVAALYQIHLATGASWEKLPN